MASRAPEAFNDQDAPREWFSATELGGFDLTGLGDRRAVNRRAQDERWTSRTDSSGALLVRPREGQRGGGLEFHVSLMPPAVRLEMAKRGLTGDRPAPVAVNSDVGGWAWFEGLTDAVRAVAARRLAIVNEIELLTSSSMTMTAAVAHASSQHKDSAATLWSWLRLVKGVAPHNRLPALAPQRKGGGVKAEIDPSLWTIYYSDATRKSRATLTSCYARTAEKAAEMGLSVPCERTFRRRLKRTDPGIFKYLREGEEAFRRSIPAERRTVNHMHAMEVVNIDGHKFDVRVVPVGGGKPIRPIMVAIQDVRSSKIVGWRLDEAETTAAARLAIADMIRDFGIPKRMTSDNGRAFTSKELSGGTKTRFRGKIKDSDPTGLLVALGVDINWAIPGRGQSKPIERAFRDLADTISRSPECDGAYTGPNPLKKPDNYESRAVPWEEFQEIVARGVRRHNAKLGRSGRDYRGRSFDQVFADTFVEMGKASTEHLRMALLAAEQKKVNSQTGEVELYGNRYWAAECSQYHGELVTVRFDPDNLHSEVHLYDKLGRFLLTAQLIADSQWGDVAGAKATAKRVKDARRRVRDGAEAQRTLAAEELAAMQADVAPVELPQPQATRLHRHRGQVAAQLKLAPAPQVVVAAQRESRVFRSLRLVGDE